RPGSAAAMTLHAVHEKGGTAAADGEARKLGVGENLVERKRSDLLQPSRLRCPRRGDLVRHVLARGLTEKPLRRPADERDRRISDDVANRPDDGGVERPQPP